MLPGNRPNGNVFQFHLATAMLSQELVPTGQKHCPFLSVHPTIGVFFFRLLEAAVCRFFENCTSSYPRLIENALDIFVHIFTGLLNWFSFSLLLSFFGHINSAFTLASLFYMKTCIFMLPYFNGIVVGSSPSSQISGNVLDKAILQF